MAMSFLSMWEAKLPPGFRFHPRDEELITDYLAKKITGEPNSSCPMMEVVDLNKVEPWELPETARVGEEWYFFTTRDKKYATGHRTNRATLSGYWKATGKDRQVTDGRRGGREVGMRKTLVFYQGRAPKGKKTDWVMHEFRAEVDLSGDHRLFPPPPTSSSSGSKDDWVLCRVFYKRRDLSPKPTNSMEENNFYNSEASCSLPPLLDTYINFDQHNQPLINNNNDNNLQGYKIEQVPCFSNLRFHPLPALPIPTIESKISLSSSCPSSLPQLDSRWSACGPGQPTLGTVQVRPVWSNNPDGPHHLPRRAMPVGLVHLACLSRRAGHAK